VQYSITWAWCLQDKSDYALGIDGELLVADIISRTRIAKKISNDVAHEGGDEMSFCELAGEDKNLVTDSDQQKILNMIREACPEDRDTLVRIIECLAEDMQ
jgi:hypothetical protein